MRYRFRGLIRETGKPVEGHVEAPSEEVAYQVMGDNGIVCENLVEDPRAGDFTDENQPQAEGVAPDVASAIDSALDTSASQVEFDKLAEQYKGKRVWVLDRRKIRDRVKKVVVKTIAESVTESHGKDETLEKVADAIDKMFSDQRNVATQTGPDGLAVEEQIARLSAVVRKVESSVAQLNNMIRRGGIGGGRGGGGQAYDIPQADKRHDKVLLEIFETNLELQRTINDPEPQPAADAATETAAEKSD